MTLRNGKFYDSAGNIVPLEFGNWQQIRLLEGMKSLKEGVFMPIDLTCPCGATVPSYGNWETQTEKKVPCPGCGLIYKYYLYDDEIPSVKLLS